MLSLIQRLKDWNEEQLRIERENEEKRRADRESIEVSQHVEPMDTPQYTTLAPLLTSQNEEESLEQLLRRTCGNINRIAVLCLVIIAATCVISFRAVSIQQTQKWEYEIIYAADRDFDYKIADAGFMGWELVFARRASSTGDKMGYEMIFKRPKK